MDITVEKTIENKYLQRKELHGKVAFTGATPSQKQFADALAQKTGAKTDAIFIQHLFPSFGAQNATFEAHIYTSKEQLEKVVRLGKKAKEKLAKPAAQAASADQPAKSAAAEAPKVEEKKAEAKKEAPAKAEEKKPEVKKEAPVAKPVEKAAEPKKEEAKA